MPDGCQQQEPTLLPRGHQLHLPQLGDGALPPPDLPQGPDRPHGVLAHPGPGYVPRCAHFLPLSKELNKTLSPSSLLPPSKTKEVYIDSSTERFVFVKELTL